MDEVCLHLVQAHDSYSLIRQGITLTVLEGPTETHYHLAPLSQLQQRVLSLPNFPADIYTQLAVNSRKLRFKTSEPADSSQRKWKIKATATLRGSYQPSIRWAMTAADIVAAGMNNYCDSVRAWAQSV
jgi:hypothetical protein